MDPIFHILAIILIHIMSRLEKLLEKELNTPHNYDQLKENPFPLEIFQFIFQLEADNLNLSQKINAKFPHKSLQQCMKEHAALQAKQKLIAINKETINKMDIEIKDKLEQTQKLRQRNAALQIESQALTLSFQQAEKQLIEVEKEKRFLEMKLKMQRQRESKNVDLSAILSNLYKQVKQTLNESL